MRLLFLLGGCLALAFVQAAPKEPIRPVAVGISFEHLSYVLNEEIPVKLWVRNNTPNTLVLGKGDTPSGVLEVRLVGDTAKRSLVLGKGGCLPRPLQLKPGEERTFSIDLVQAADLSNAGKFLVSFGVIVRDMCYETALKSIEVVPGYPVAEGVQSFTSRPNVHRTIKLVRWARNHVDRLFLRVEDEPSGQVFPTVMLGAYLSLSKPRMNIAPSGEITILHRATPEHYVRNVFWSLEDEFVRRSRQNVLDPATADSARLNGMRADLEEIVDKNDKLKESLRLR